MRHYRKWVAVRAYWQRHYDKWIVGERIFYTDEVWDDLFSCLLVGVGVNFVYFICIVPFADGSFELQMFISGAAATPLLLFATRQYDRFQLADDEIIRRQQMEPSFSAAHEIQQLLDGDQKYIRRIIGQHSKRKT